MTIEQADKQYHEYLEGHIGNVQEALELLHTLGIQFIDDNYEELKSICQNHDASKYSDEEYIPYREHFYPTCDEDKLKTEAFELACRHHIKNNKHHWDYWLDENNQLDIPDEKEYKLYCVERCCDWLAMSCQHDEPSSAWYHANKESIQMPDYGWELCDEIMSKVPEKCDFTFKGTRGDLDESYIQPRGEERTYTLYHCSSSPNISEFNELHFEENSLGGTTYGNAIYFTDSIESVLTYNSRRRKYIYECNVQCKHVISSREYSIILSNEDKKRDFDNTVWGASERRKVMLEHNIDAVDDLPSELAVFNLDCIKSVKLIKSLNESYAYARDVTTKELDRNHVMFITYGSYGEHVEHFDNVARLFDYIKSCGGFKEFKGIMWFIKSDYKDGEFYLVRDRYHKGGWKWEDVNGSIVDAFDSKTFAIKPDKKAAVKQMYNAGDGTFMIDLNDGWVTDYGTNYIQATDKNDAILELNHRVSYIGSNNEMNESSDYWKSLKPQIEDTENDRKGVEMYKEKISNGYHRPVLVNKNNEILDGNHTMTAYQELGIEPKMLYRGERSDFYKAAAETKGDAEKAIHVMIDNGTAKQINEAVGPSKEYLKKNFKKVKFNSNFSSAEIVTEEYEPIPKSLKGWIYNNQFPHYPLEDNNGKQYMYHNTDAKNIPSIIENGLRTGQNLKSYSKSPEEGNVIWCDDNNAESSGFGGSTVVFSIPKEDAEKYKVNNTQYAIPYDILSKDILFIDRLICSQPSIKVSDIPAYVNKFGKDKVIDVISKKNPDCPIVDIIGRASEKNLIESFKVVNRPGGGYLLEASMKQLKRKTLSEDPTRAKKSKHVQSKYIGISKYGVLNFETTSETHSGVTWYQEVHFPSFNGFMNIIEEGDVIEAEDVKKAMSSDNIKISCFTEDTEVQTLEGMKKIKDIKVGDKVLTHTGKYQDVLQTFENDYNGEMIEINGVKSTPNHPYLVKLPNGDIEWKMACEITKDMKLLEVEE